MNNSLFFNILTSRQRQLLPKLKFLKQMDFYLAGGTGLALQLGHRTSQDFDFYRFESFSPAKLLLKLQKVVNKIELVQESEDTLIVRLDDVITSFFVYPYPLLKPVIEANNVNIASIEDIGCMKVIAIIQRGTKRDFIDIFFLTQILSLQRLLKLAKKKYKGFNIYLALQSLTYFDDAEKEKLTTRTIKILKPNTWQEIKKYFIEQIREIKKTL